MLDRQRLKQAFGLLGDDLARRHLFVELAVYGGSALIMQFDRRRTTQDVDAVVTAGGLAAELGIDDTAALEALFVSIHREAPSETVKRRLAAVVERT